MNTINFIISYLASFLSFILTILFIFLFSYLTGTRFSSSDIQLFILMYIPLVLVGCLLGEGLFRMNITKFFRFFIVGLLYGAILYILLSNNSNYVSSSDTINLIAFSLVACLGSVIYYLFRRKTFL